MLFGRGAGPAAETPTCSVAAQGIGERDEVPPGTASCPKSAQTTFPPNANNFFLVLSARNRAKIGRGTTSPEMLRKKSSVPQGCCGGGWRQRVPPGESLLQLLTCSRLYLINQQQGGNLESGLCRWSSRKQDVLSALELLSGARGCARRGNGAVTQRRSRSSWRLRAGSALGFAAPEHGPHVPAAPFHPGMVWKRVASPRGCDEMNFPRQPFLAVLFPPLVR